MIISSIFFYDILDYSMTLKICSCAIRDGLLFADDRGLTHPNDESRMRQAFALLGKFDIKYDTGYLNSQLLVHSNLSNKLVKDILNAAKNPDMGNREIILLESVDKWKKMASDPQFNAIKHLQKWCPIGSKR